MAQRNNRGLVFLSLFVTGVFLMPFISSCGKGGASKVGYNVQIQILNLSPDVHPVNLYVDFLKQNTTPYYYPNPSGYFYLNSIDTPLQIRSASVTTTNLLSIDKNMVANHKYSLFITGLASDSTITSIFTYDDTAAIPQPGFGKIRFVNASLPNTALDVTANGTLTSNFHNIAYKQISNYVQMPAGNYSFQVTATATPGAALSTLQNATIQDGRLYTLYTYGIALHSDTSAFGMQLLINR